MSAASKREGVARLALYAAPILLAGLAAFLYFGSGAEEAASHVGSVQVAGSETMRPVVTACAEEFMTRNPEADIVVKGGGSGDGIAAVLHGVVDIGMASRELTSRERDYALANGIEISEFRLALDGVTVIVHPANPTEALDLTQLRDVFAGRIRNWRELGGAEGEIQVFARAAGSGTASLFAERVLGKDPEAATVQHLPTNEAIVAEVASLPQAIGYTGLGALKGAGDRVKVVAVRRDAGSGPVSPTPDAIRSGNYPLTRTLSFAAAGKQSGTVGAFIDFCTGASGQALLQKAGYVGVDAAVQ